MRPRLALICVDCSLSGADDPDSLLESRQQCVEFLSLGAQCRRSEDSGNCATASPRRITSCRALRSGPRSLIAGLAQGVGLLGQMVEPADPSGDGKNLPSSGRQCPKIPDGNPATQRRERPAPGSAAAFWRGLAASGTGAFQLADFRGQSALVGGAQKTNQCAQRVPTRSGEVRSLVTSSRSTSRPGA